MSDQEEEKEMQIQEKKPKRQRVAESDADEQEEQEEQIQPSSPRYQQQQVVNQRGFEYDEDEEEDQTYDANEYLSRVQQEVIQKDKPRVDLKKMEDLLKKREPGQFQRKVVIAGEPDVQIPIKVERYDDNDNRRREKINERVQKRISSRLAINQAKKREKETLEKIQKDDQNIVDGFFRSKETIDKSWGDQQAELLTPEVQYLQQQNPAKEMYVQEVIGAESGEIFKPYFQIQQRLKFQNAKQADALSLVRLVKQANQWDGPPQAVLKLFDTKAKDLYNEIICFTAILITISDDFAELSFNGECPLTLQQFERFCQAHNSIDFDFRRQIPPEKLVLDQDQFMKEVLGEDSEINYLFFNKMVYYLFQDSFSPAAQYQKIISQPDIRNQAPEWMNNVKGAVQYFDQQRWRDEFIEPDGTEFIYEDVANRLNVSKLQIIRVYKFIFLLINYLGEYQTFGDFAQKGFQFRAALRWLFLPRSLKDISNNKIFEMNSLQIKPILGSICHYLIQVCLQIEIFSRDLFTQRFNERTMDFKVVNVGQVKIDQEQWEDLNPADKQIEVREVKPVRKSKKIQKSELAFFQSFKNKSKKQIENIKLMRKQELERRNNIRKKLKAENNLVSEYTQKVYCNIGAQEQRLFRPKKLNNQVGGLQAEKVSLPIQQHMNGNVAVRRDFVQCFNNVQRNLDVVAKLLVVLKENTKRELENMNQQQNVHHYIQLTLSAFYRPEERGQDQQQRRFTTVGFKFSDSESLKDLSENQISQIVANNVYDKIIFIIAQHLEYYLDADDNFDSMKIDFSSLCIDRFSVSTLHEGFKLYNNVIKLNEGEFRYHILDEDIGRIVAYFKGDIVNDPQYKKSKVEDFDDDDDFQCTMNVASYLWCKLNNKKHDKQSKLAFFFSKEYAHLEKYIIEGLVNEVFRYFKQTKKMNIALFFPQTFVLYMSQKFSEDTIWIFVKLGHCWIGQHREIYEDAAKIDKKLVKDKFAQNKPENIFEQRKKQMLKVFSLPGSMRSGKDSEITFVFYDIETLQNERGQNKLQQPFLLCYKAIELDFSKNQIQERGHFMSENCCEQFVDYLDSLSEKLAAKKQQIMINQKLQRVPNFKIYVYAHNGGKFDHLFLQQAVMRKHSKSYQILGTATNLKWASYNNVVFRDSVMLIPGRLDDLCKAFKIKGKNDFDAKTITRDKLKDPDYAQMVLDYCYQDVDCLCDLLFAFKEKFGQIIQNFKFSDIKQTLPATALHVFQKFFMSKDVYIYGNLLSSQQGVAVQNFERSSYRGGHCQVFKHGEASDLVYWDFVSMYVSIMHGELFPISQGKLEVFNNKIENTCLYILSSFKFKDGTRITNIPLRDSETNITIYPLKFNSGDAGQDYVAVWGRELQLAFDFLGLEIQNLKVRNVIRYENWGNEFVKYMGTFFEIKEKAGPDEEAIKIIAKLFGNSLYGKLGQKNETSRQLISVAEARILGDNGLQQMLGPPEQFFHYQKDANKQQNIVKNIQKLSDNVLQVMYEDPSAEFRSSGSVVRIASFITMCGRCKLIKLINEIGYDAIRYCDTDSVVFKPYKKMKVSTKVGKKLGDVSDQLPGCRVQSSDFVAAKCYYLQLDKDPKFKPYKGKYEFVRFKGVSNPSIQKIKDLRTSGETSFIQEQFRRKWNGVGVEEIDKKIRLGTKRFVEPDGNTRPFLDWNEYQIYFDKVLKLNNKKYEYFN